MLVKEGHKGSYLLWGVVQIVLSVLLIALIAPLMLSGLGIDTSVWLELVNKIKAWVGGKYIFGAIHAIIVVLFITTVLSIFFRKSGASLFIKISAAAAMFPFACKGLKTLVQEMFDKNIDIMAMFSGGIEYLLLAVSVVLLILGFVFQFTVSRNNEKKANLFLFSKSIVWIVLLALNYVVPSILSSSTWLMALFGYSLYPYFLCWYFLIMGIFQLISSPQLINPNDSKFSTGTQPPIAPVAYIPVQPVMVDPFTPVMPNNPALQGRRQGLDDQSETPVESINESAPQGLEAQPEAENGFIAVPNEQPQMEQPTESQIPAEPTTEALPETPQSEYVENLSTNEPSIEGDTVVQGLTPPDNYEETQTLEQIREKYVPVTPVENKPVQKEELGREFGEEKVSQPKQEKEAEEENAADKPVYLKDLEEKLDEVKPLETPKLEPPELSQKEPEKAPEEIAPIIPAKPAKAKKTTTKKATTKKAKKEEKPVEKKKKEPAKVATKKAATTKKVTEKPAKKETPKQALKTKAVKKVEKTKADEPKIEKPKELSQSEKLKEIDKIIKTLSSPRQTSRTRKIRRDNDEEE